MAPCGVGTVGEREHEGSVVGSENTYYSHNTCSCATLLDSFTM